MRFLLRMLALALLAVQVGGCASMSEMGNEFGGWINRLKQMAVSPSTETSTATRDDAVRKYAYTTAQGTRIEVESATNTPHSVAPGETLESSVRYTVIGPEKIRSVSLTATRTVIIDDEAIQLGKPRRWESPQGTHTAVVKITIPKNMPKGDYKLIITISDNRVTKTARTIFSVI